MMRALAYADALITNRGQIRNICPCHVDILALKNAVISRLPAINFEGACMFILGGQKTGLKVLQTIGGIKWLTKEISDCFSKCLSMSMI